MEPRQPQQEQECKGFWDGILKKKKKKIKATEGFV
jgi:hypothetical protein